MIIAASLVASYTDRQFRDPSKLNFILGAIINGWQYLSQI